MTPVAQQPEVSVTVFVPENAPNDFNVKHKDCRQVSLILAYDCE